MSDAFSRIIADPKLARARQKLSIDEIRMILLHARAAEDAVPYDPQGPEVSLLHRWFAEHASPSDWHDDGCRSENARDLLNALACGGFIVVPVPLSPSTDTQEGGE